jgi:hypothetical protein
VVELDVDLDVQFSRSAARAEALEAPDRSHSPGAFLLVFPAVALLSGATFSHLPKSVS